MALKPIQILINAKDNASEVLDKLSKKLTGVGAATRSWAASIGKIAAGNVLANMFGLISSKVHEAGRAFVQANIQIDGMRRAFTAIYKDAGLAESQIAFLRKTSTQAGVSFSTLGDSFKTFAAASHAANIPVSVTNDLFASVTKASATLGLSSERTSLVLQALGQMASKGTVSMEELRQQLGESLPGALSLSAKGLGLTEAELIKLVETGGLAARDLFPALAQSLKTMQGENNGLQGSWERLKTAINGVMTSIGDAGGMQIMTVAVKALGGALGLVIVPIQAIVEAFLGMVRGAGAAAAAIGILADTSTTWAQKAAGLREVGSALADSFDQADARLLSTASGFASVVTGSDSAAASLQASASAAGMSTEAAAQYAQQWIGIGQAMRDAAAEQEKSAANSVKLAQAAEAEGKAMVALVALRGNATATAQAEAAASASSATALQAVADARSKQLEVVQAELTSKKALIEGNAQEQKAREQEIKTLTDKVEKLKAESAAATQSAEAAKNESIAKQAAAEATQNHAGEIAKFTAELQASVTTVREYERLQLEGKKTTEDVTEAKRQQALAEARLRDALKDSIDSARAIAITKKAEAEATISLLETQKSLLGQTEEMARLMGNESRARDLRIKQMEIDIQITLAKAESMRVEAEGSINVARANLEELRVKGELTSVKEAELNASIKLAEAKLKEADAIGKSTDLIKQAIYNVKMYGDTVHREGGRSRAATDNMAGGWKGVSGATQEAIQKAADFQKRMKEKYGRPGDDAASSFDAAAAAAQRATDAAKKYDAYMESRFERGWAQNEDGQTVVAREDTALRNQRLAAMFGADMIGNANADAAYNLTRRIEQLDKNSFGEGDGSLGLLRQELQRLVAAMEADRAAMRQKGQGGTAPTPSAPAANDDGRAPTRSGRASGISAGAGATYISNITIGGQRTTIRTADAESQSALDQLLRDLGTARGAAA